MPFFTKISINSFLLIGIIKFPKSKTIQICFYFNENNPVKPLNPPLINFKSN